MTLIQEKVKQAAGLLREFGVDCWITFTRESEICGDPTLVFLAPGPVTWHSAFIVCADGRTRAIVGLYDQKGIEETGAYDKVVGYVTGIKEPLLDCLAGVRSPDDRRQLLRSERDLRRPDPRHVPDPPRVPRRDRHGRAARLRREDRLGAPRAEVGGRDRLDEAGRPGDRGDLRPRRRLHRPGPDGERDRRVHPGRSRAPQAPHGLGRRRPARPSSPAPTRPRPTTRRRAGPSSPATSSTWTSASRSRATARTCRGPSTSSPPARRPLPRTS